MSDVVLIPPANKTKRLAFFYQVKISLIEQYHMPLKALRPATLGLVGTLPDTSELWPAVQFGIEIRVGKLDSLA